MLPAKWQANLPYLRDRAERVDLVEKTAALLTALRR